jgi:hypothetical protein
LTTTARSASSWQLHCSRNALAGPRSPSMFKADNLIQPFGTHLLGQTPHAATMKVCSLDQQPLSIKIKRTGARIARGRCGQHWLLF